VAGGKKASWGMAANQDMFRATFRAFSGPLGTMDSESFVLLCKRCFLLDAHQLPAAEAAKICNLAASPSIRLDLLAFEHALDMVTERRGLSKELVRRTVALCGTPCSSHRIVKKEEALQNAISSRVHSLAPQLEPSEELEAKVKAREALMRVFGGDATSEMTAVQLDEVKEKACDALLVALGEDDADDIAQDLCEDGATDPAQVKEAKAAARRALQTAFGLME